MACCRGGGAAWTRLGYEALQTSKDVLYCDGMWCPPQCGGHIVSPPSGETLAGPINTNSVQEAMQAWQYMISTIWRQVHSIHILNDDDCPHNILLWFQHSMIENWDAWAVHQQLAVVADWMCWWRLEVFDFFLDGIWWKTFYTNSSYLGGDQITPHVLPLPMWEQCHPQLQQFSAQTGWVNTLLSPCPFGLQWPAILLFTSTLMSNPFFYVYECTVFQTWSNHHFKHTRPLTPLPFINARGQHAKKNIFNCLNFIVECLQFLFLAFGLMACFRYLIVVMHSGKSNLQALLRQICIY